MTDQNFYYSACRAVIAEAFGCAGDQPNLAGWQAKIVGLAGLCATQVEAEGPDVDAWRIIDWLNSGAISLSLDDRILAGQFDEDDVSEALAWILQYWPAIEQLATSLKSLPQAA